MPCLLFFDYYLSKPIRIIKFSCAIVFLSSLFYIYYRCSFKIYENFYQPGFFFTFFSEDIESEWMFMISCHSFSIMNVRLRVKLKNETS